MNDDLRDEIRQATALPIVGCSEFVRLLKLIDAHYDREKANVSETVPACVPAGPTPLAVIFDSVTEALILLGESGNIRFCNLMLGRLFGLDREALIGSSIENFLPAAAGLTMTEFLEPFMSRLDATPFGPARGEVSVCGADGRECFAEIDAKRIDTTEGAVYVATLRENESYHGALVENASEAIVVLDVDANRFIDANDKACRLFKLSRASLLTLGLEAISPTVQPDGTPFSDVRRGFIDKALSGGHPSFEWLHTDSTGAEILYEVRLSRLSDARRRLIRVSATDIMARKRKQALADAQSKVLEMIAANQPCDLMLRAICYFVEHMGRSMRAAVMQMDADRKCLSLSQAPSLSEELCRCLDQLCIRADGPTPGAAAYHNKDCVARDIAEEPGWSEHSALLERNDVGAVWSFPITGPADTVLGTLDIYLNESRTPSIDELDYLGQMTRLARIVINREHNEERLRRSEARYRGLFENVVDGVFIATREGELIMANPALIEMLGYDDTSDLKAAGDTGLLYVNPVDRERVFAQLKSQGFVRNFEYRLRRKDGKEIVVLENSRALYDDNGCMFAHEGTLSDITDRKLAEIRIFKEKERAQVTLQSISDGVVTTDAEGRIDYINPVAQDLTGWNMRCAQGRPVGEIMTIVNEHTRASVENPVVTCLKEGRVITLAQNSILITRRGDEVPIQDSAAPIRDRTGNIIGSVMVLHDTGKESRLFRQLNYQAAHDSTTGLINRREFENRLMASLDRLRSSHPDTMHALLYVDLDQFKVVNDTFGHTAGDELLRQLSELIKTLIRSTDELARLGGDEFGILLERCSEEHAMQVAESIRDEIGGYRFEWQDSFTTVRCSLGVVVFTADAKDVASIMSSADVACYSAKDKGRNQVHVYQDGDAALRHEEMKWVSRISSAVEEDRLELFFQPIISIGDAGHAGRGHYELLLRMHDEKGRLIGPDQFIPAAERYNMMSTLDRWVIHKTLADLADRDSEGEAGYMLAINLSGTSLSEDRFLDYVISELEAYELPKGAICFEITETAAISNLARVVHFMQTLKRLGCLFSLDDFGSGLSSFTYLKNLPVDYLKIDGQFIRNVVEDSVDESMVKAIREIGQAMGIETIAERVETKQVLDKLSSLGVGFAQGYYIARPESVSSFEPWGDAAPERRRASGAAP